VSLRRLSPIFLRLLNLLLLLARSSASTDIELLVLRHELAVLHRATPKPRLDWADRAMFAALARALPTMLRRRRLLVAKKWTYPTVSGVHPSRTRWPR
jgi:putative transposase